MTDNPAAPRAVLSDRDLFAREDLTPEDIEASCDPFLLDLQRLREVKTSWRLGRIEPGQPWSNAADLCPFG